MGEKIEVENVNVPGHVARVDAAKYHAVKELMLAALPTDAPGMTAAEIKDAIRDDLPQDLFPGGKTLGWWQRRCSWIWKRKVSWRALRRNP